MKTWRCWMCCLIYKACTRSKWRMNLACDTLHTKVVIYKTTTRPESVRSPTPALTLLYGGATHFILVWSLSKSIVLNRKDAVSFFFHNLAQHLSKKSGLLRARALEPGVMVLLWSRTDPRWISGWIYENYWTWCGPMVLLGLFCF